MSAPSTPTDNNTAGPATVATDTPSARRRRLALWILAFALVCIGPLCVGLETAIHFDGPPIDGPFQLYNALRRIAAGQRVGVDFQFFHGAGVPYLHLVPFWIFGGGFFASEIARQVVSVVLFALTFVIVFFAWTRDWTATMRLSIAGVLAAIILRLDAVYLPINSILGVRSTMPIWFAAALALSVRPIWRSAIAGAALGAALLLGTEQGMAVLAAFVVAQLIVAVRTRRWRASVAEAVVTTAVGIATYAVVLIALGGWAGLKGAARYNFQLVPMDQFWYFGGPPNRFMSRLGQIADLPFAIPWIAATACVALLVVTRLWRSPDGADDRRRIGEAVLGVYGAMSMASILGVLVIVYLEAAVRIDIIVLLLAVYREADRIPVLRAPNPLWRRWRSAAGVISLLLIATTTRFRAMSAATLAPLHVVVSHVISGDRPGLSPAWTDALTTGRRLVDEFEKREHRRPVVWSTYATMLESSEGMFHPSFDYIIHALGPQNRRAYAAAFSASHPDIVQTIKPSYTYYEEWLEDNDWWLYRNLLRDYQIVGETKWSYFWERRSDSSLPARRIAEGPLGPGQTTATVGVIAPADTLSLLQVRMRYHVDNPWRRLPVVGSLPRYVVEISGAANLSAVSLSPYDSVRTFPVIVDGPSTVGLRFSTVALAGNARLVVDSLQVFELRIPPGATAWARNFSSPRFIPPALR